MDTHTTASPQEATMVKNITMGILMLDRLKIRQYRARMENLTKTMTPV